MAHEEYGAALPRRDVYVPGYATETHVQQPSAPDGTQPVSELPSVVSKETTIPVSRPAETDIVPEATHAKYGTEPLRCPVSVEYPKIESPREYPSAFMEYPSSPVEYPSSPVKYPLLPWSIPLPDICGTGWENRCLQHGL